jgi:hypothetical protein
MGDLNIEAALKPSVPANVANRLCLRSAARNYIIRTANA